ncbi:unnamed protein product [Bursaphelenchus xylophilus]|uniref:(pine wood nematode) hypothetical protein n=1 Tax=Bursaphelenchus xylophilus TaxID=6326 RepID=A0A1I7SJ84_BURXY|nr:unnamed protein product [Bursaphelenchus xylophilus]CAG9111061.1 unnamed protein product [Bursaphelenchus xylophilus]
MEVPTRPERVKVNGKAWRSATDKSVGIWVEDVVAVLNNADYKAFQLGTIAFALKIYDALYVDRSLRRQGEIGFGRDPAVPNIVELLYRHGHISYPGLSIAYVAKLAPLYSLGSYRSEFCQGDRTTVDAVGEREWMFDAMAAAFLDYQSAAHDFRIILSAGGGIRMPRHVLLSFINSNLIMAHRQQYNFFQLNETRRNDDFKFFFRINPEYVIDSDLQSIGLPLFGGNSTTFIAEAVDPNPDNVEWVVGRMIFINYCVFLDYRQNQISFSKLKKQ